MRVSRNFEKIYRNEADPWSIGNADSPRYNAYLEEIRRHFPAERRLALDVGAGFGVFLSRFREDFKELTAVEVSDVAVAKGRERFPFIRFIREDAARLDSLVPELAGRCDLIICSDVLYYLPERKRKACLRALAALLAPGGVAAIAAWCPGGKYLEPDELQRLVSQEFRIKDSKLYETRHLLLIAERKRRLVSLTIDYETWQPVPAGMRIDWEKDVFDPARRFIDIGRAANVPFTFMAEMGEYIWLRKFKPELAAKMEEQWREAISKGHDVQLHLHPSWLPETGAAEANGNYRWDADKSKFEDYPGDAVELVARVKDALEAAVRAAKPDYRATCFRAGAYQAQPFTRLREALIKNGITADSSVHLGGVSAERGYDYSFAYSDHQPFFASAYDPQLKACPAEAGLLEIPVFTWKPGERWFLDGGEGPMLAERLLSYHDRRPSSTEVYRLGKRLKRAWRSVYGRLTFARPLLNRNLPRGLAYALVEHPPLPEAQHDYFVAIGHTKGDHDFDAIGKNLETLKRDGRFEFVGLGEMAAAARRELVGGTRASAAEEAAHEVQRASDEAPSSYLQEKIPFDRSRILDLGRGAGTQSARIAERMPWAKVTVQTGDFANLPFTAGAFDCVCADDVLEHALDVDAVMREAFRVLEGGGFLVAAIPSDGRNPKRSTDEHTWKTIPSDVRFRLARAGFSKIRIEEVDVRARFGLVPYPPSFDRMMYVVCEKREAGSGDRERALRAMRWVHERLDPSRGQTTNDPHEILKQGCAFCWGFVVALGTILKKEGFDVTWISMIAQDHPRGRGPEKTDSHEVLEMRVDGDMIVLDPMANTVHEHSVEEMVRTPSLARGNPSPDAVHRERGYELYDTAEWYGRVVKVARRRDYADRLEWKAAAPRGPASA